VVHPSSHKPIYPLVHNHFIVYQSEFAFYPLVHNQFITYQLWFFRLVIVSITHACLILIFLIKALVRIVLACGVLSRLDFLLYSRDTNYCKARTGTFGGGRVGVWHQYVSSPRCFPDNHVISQHLQILKSAQVTGGQLSTNLHLPHPQLVLPLLVDHHLRFTWPVSR
jgi:hypothetical protein